MRTLFFNKDGRGYQEYPVPEDTTGYDVVTVDDDFELGDRYYDATSMTFKDNPDAIADYNEAMDFYRRSSYAREVDPLTLEATLKQGMGLTLEASTIFKLADNKRKEIQEMYPFK